MEEGIPQTAEAYMQVVRTLGAMTDRALDELSTRRFLDERDKQRTLTRAAEAIETIASLRGDSLLFDTQRPKDLAGYQTEMYALEDVLRTKLLGLGYVYPQR